MNIRAGNSSIFLGKEESKKLLVLKIIIKNHYFKIPEPTRN
jgi:hypothetical protein